MRFAYDVVCVLCLVGATPAPDDEDDVEQRQQDHPNEDAGDEVRVDKEVSPLPPGTGLVTRSLVWGRISELNNNRKQTK